MIETLLQADGNLLLWIQENLRTPVLTVFFKTVTRLGNAGMIWILITLLLLIMKSTRKIGAMCAVTLVLSLIFNNGLIKNLVARPRPYTQLPDLILLVPRPSEYSFPSGHAGSSFCVGWTMFRKMPGRYGIPALALAVLIAFSRLYVGVHYPTDVLCGVLLGIGLSYLGEWIVMRVCDRKKEGPGC